MRMGVIVNVTWCKFHQSNDKDLYVSYNGRIAKYEHHRRGFNTTVFEVYKRWKTVFLALNNQLYIKLYSASYIMLGIITSS